jgi:hypothetical protein
MHSEACARTIVQNENSWMNIFIEALRKGEVNTEIELKRMFWKLAKKLHPDVSCVERNNELFVSLKRQFDEASAEIGAHLSIADEPHRNPDRSLCMRLFGDLVAGNFPIDKRVKDRNKIYCKRLGELNRELGRFGRDFRDLFVGVESELYVLRGKTTVSNHEFNLVKLFFYRISDYGFFKTKNTLNYLRVGYPMLIDIFKNRNMEKSIVFFDWLVQGIL